MWMKKKKKAGGRSWTKDAGGESKLLLRVCSWLLAEALTGQDCVLNLRSMHATYTNKTSFYNLFAFGFQSH
jgi:hypothetical protein